MARKAKKRAVARVNSREWLIIALCGGSDAFTNIVSKLGIRRQVFNAMFRELLRTAGQSMHYPGRLACELAKRYVLEPSSQFALRKLLVANGEACRLKEIIHTQKLVDPTAEEVLCMAERNFRHGSDKRYDWSAWHELEKMAGDDHDLRYKVGKMHRQAKQDDDFDL